MGLMLTALIMILWISDSGFSNMYIQQLDRWRLEPGDERIFYKVKEVYI